MTGSLSVPCLNRRFTVGVLATIRPTQESDSGHRHNASPLKSEEDGSMRLCLSSRTIGLMAMPDSGYVAASGLDIGIPVACSRDGSGKPADG